MDQAIGRRWAASDLLPNSLFHVGALHVTVESLMSLDIIASATTPSPLRRLDLRTLGAHHPRLWIRCSFGIPRTRPGDAISGYRRAKFIAT